MESDLGVCVFDLHLLLLRRRRLIISRRIIEKPRRNRRSSKRRSGTTTQVGREATDLPETTTATVPRTGGGCLRWATIGGLTALIDRRPLETVSRTISSILSDFTGSVAAARWGNRIAGRGTFTARRPLGCPGTIKKHVTPIIKAAVVGRRVDHASTALSNTGCCNTITILTGI